MLDKQRTSANWIYLLIARSVRRWRRLQQTQKHIYSSSTDLHITLCLKLKWHKHNLSLHLPDAH